MNLLAEKQTEHGEWSANKEIFSRLFDAAVISHQQVHGKSFHLREDFAEIASIFIKLGRILSKPADKTNCDDYRDIAGYSSLRFNAISKSQIQINEMSKE